jgi:hypothetical protein
VSIPAEIEAERLSIASEFSRLLLEMVDISQHVESHLREYATHLPHNSNPELPRSEHLAITGCTGRILQHMSQAYTALRDIEGGLQDLITIRERRGNGQTGRQQGTCEESRENTQSGSQESQEFSSQPQLQSQTAAASLPSQTTASQPPNEFSHAVDALQQVMGTPVARMEIEMDQYEAPLREVLAQGFQPPSSSSERHSNRPSVEFMFNFIQHLPIGVQRGDQRGDQEQPGHPPLPAALFRGIFPHIAVTRRAATGSQEPQSASGMQEQGSGTSEQTASSESTQSQPSLSEDRPTGESQETGGEQRQAAPVTAGQRGQVGWMSREMFRTVSETLIQAIAAYSNPVEDQPSVQEMFAGLSEALGGSRGNENTNLFGRLMATVWNVLTAPEAFALFQGHMEPLEKLQNPFRCFVSQELLNGESLTKDNIEAALDCFFEGEKEAMNYILSDCQIRADVDLHATLLHSARRRLRQVFLIIVQDYDIPNGFAVSLKEAFSSGLSELGHLARFGLEGGINALHNMLRRRLVSRMEL